MNKSMVIILIVLAAIIIVGAIVFFVVKQKKADESIPQGNNKISSYNEDTTIAESIKEDDKDSTGLEQNADSKEVSIDDYVGYWMGSGRWGWTVEKQDNDTVKVYYHGSSGATSGGDGEGIGYLKGNDLYVDIEYTEYQYSTNEKDTSHEPATISLGHFTDVVKLASLFPSGYTCKENERILASDRIYADETVTEEYNSYSVDNTNQCDPPENYAVWKSDYFTSNGVGSDYILWYSSDILVSDYDLCSLSPENLKLARNEIFARHGRLFKDENIQKYFDSRSWYNGYIQPEQFDDSVFSKIEKDNINLIKKYEESTKPTEEITHGDVREISYAGDMYMYKGLKGYKLYIESVYPVEDKGSYYEVPCCRISIDLDGGTAEDVEAVVSYSETVKIKKDALFFIGNESYMTAQELMNTYGKLFIPDYDNTTLGSYDGRFDRDGYLVSGTAWGFS